MPRLSLRCPPGPGVACPLRWSRAGLPGPSYPNWGLTSIVAATRPPVLEPDLDDLFCVGGTEPMWPMTPAGHKLHRLHEDDERALCDGRWVWPWRWWEDDGVPRRSDP